MAVRVGAFGICARQTFVCRPNFSVPAHWGYSDWELGLAHMPPGGGKWEAKPKPEMIAAVRRDFRFD